MKIYVIYWGTYDDPGYIGEQCYLVEADAWSVIKSYGYVTNPYNDKEMCNGGKYAYVQECTLFVRN